MSVEIFTSKLLAWYAKNKRDFSWRRTKCPYRILVAEMMLQKTTAKQVTKFFDTFIEKYPSPEAWAKASMSEIEEMITPLGMEHRRANRFKKWAGEIVNKYNGKIPDNRRDLLALTGVGDYIANSVLCLGYGRELPLLDTNIVRVLKRIFGIESSKARARTDKGLWATVKRMMPKGMAREFNLGLVDFGALVCVAKNPKCDNCPMTDFCLWACARKYT